jgi:hypothetical protein
MLSALAAGATVRRAGLAQAIVETQEFPDADKFA